MVSRKKVIPELDAVYAKIVEKCGNLKSDIQWAKIWLKLSNDIQKNS